MGTVSRTTMAGVSLIFACLLMAVWASSADADRIRSGNCDLYQAVLDPIAPTSNHTHLFGMGSVRSNSDTGFDYKARGTTTCQSDNSRWATSGGWFPRAQGFVADGMTAYYRDPGEIRVNPIPTDLKMLSDELVFNSQGNPAALTIHFPNCVQKRFDGSIVLDSQNHMSHLYDANNNPCPTSHPYRIPRTSFLIQWPQRFTPSTMVSIGSGQWGPAGTYMHGDYHSGLQDEFNFTTSRGPALIDLCLNGVPESRDVAHPRCGPEPG